MTRAQEGRAAGSSAIVGLNAVIVSVDGTTPRLLTVVAPAGEALPSGDLDDELDPTLERGVRRLVGAQLALPVRYFEQLYTFGDRDRAPLGRALAVAYLALARHQPVQGPGKPRWRDWYELLPWEDWRRGRPAVLDEVVAPVLDHWLVSSPASELATRTERADLTFGTGQARWDPMRVLDRYELLYELALVEEAARDRAAKPVQPVSPGPPVSASQLVSKALSGRAASHGHPIEHGRLGPALALDHRRIAAAALERLRGKLAYRPVVFEVLPEAFTLSVLQQVVEAFAGQALHKQNFRRLVATSNLVEPTGEVDQRTGGRPAELYRFRREVLRERPAPGIGLRRLGGP